MRLPTTCPTPFPILLSTLLAVLAAAPSAGGEAPAKPTERAPYQDMYAGYRPDFIARIKEGDHYGGPFRGWVQPPKKMKLSTEKSFFTLNQIREDSRANALAEAGAEKEQKELYRQALQIYHRLITRYPDQLYRVSRYGVFVPVAQYAQRRLLDFPPQHLAHYRTLHDAGAKEAFESARRKNSLIGLSEIIDTMLATSFGGRAIFELGNASLDSGHYLAALERYATICDFFPDMNLRTPELRLKMAYCRKMLGRDTGDLPKQQAKGRLTERQVTQLSDVLETATYEKAPFHSQRASAPHRSADDYTLFPPSPDPLAIQEPVWSERLAGSRNDFYVYSQPVVTEHSVIYRHKNIVYARSILTGEARWINDLGGRAKWQTWEERQYPQEGMLVQDGLVFTVISKGGPSVVALDEVTGQLRWAYGPMVASTKAEARMRFEAAPAGGPMTVYAGYVLDNIEGESHTDTAYGVIAFESTTGRIRWQRELCRLAPGKFSAGFAVRRRNRIRSFTSPPLYHQGTVYYCTNAGAVVALDGLSGRIKWLMRYPYYPNPNVHDATRQFGSGGGRVQYSPVYFRPHRPMFWYNQRPLIVGERLYVTPVDTPFLLCLERGTGKVMWTKRKGTNGTGYFLGPIRSGELCLVYSGRKRKIRGHWGPAPVQLVDPKNGKTMWQSEDLVKHDPQPVMKYRSRVDRHHRIGMGANGWWHEMAARPFLTADGTLYAISFSYRGYPVFGWCTNMGIVSLTGREITEKRRYYSGELLGRATWHIRTHSPEIIEMLEDLPHKSDRVKEQIRMAKEVAADTVPENRFGPFLPFSRVTFRRYGRTFELRFAARSVSMVYDRPAVRTAVSERDDPDAQFAFAELCLAETRLDEAASLLKSCLRRASSEDLDFRALVKQQLFRAHKRLARSAIRARRRDRELENALGMSRTASTLPEEMETLFALADAYARQEKYASAARCLRSVVGTYGHHEYPVAPVAVGDTERALTAANEVFDEVGGYVRNPFYADEMSRSIALLRQGLPVYLSTVSPLPKPLTVRAGELATRRLVELQERSDELAAELDRLAAAELRGKSPAEQLYRLWEFPGTKSAQQVLDKLFEGAAGGEGGPDMPLLWRLADAARVSRLDVPQPYRPLVSAPTHVPETAPAKLPQTPRKHRYADAEGINWLVLQRRGQTDRDPHLLFLGGRVRKRLDNKFLLVCLDLRANEERWKVSRIRLRGTGQEPGFFEAFVYNDIVLVHGLYDVLAFRLADGELLWRFRVPFDFEIKHAELNGDLLVLAGAAETLALYVPTRSEAGQVAWQVQERGDLYAPPYFHGDRLVSVRKLPYSVTVRYRATGKLIGRLELPDLLMNEDHPLFEGGPKALPIAHHGRRLVVSDSWYYLMIDVERMKVVWKRQIDNSDQTRLPAMRFALRGDYFSVIKEDYDVKAIYMLSSRTGEVLWHTDPKDAESPQPVYRMFIVGDRIYGIGVHPGQGFYFVGRDCETGKLLFQTKTTGYPSKPSVDLVPTVYGGGDGPRHAIVKVKSRQEFEVKLFDFDTGADLYTVKDKGAGDFGVHGQVSATCQDGRVVLMSKDRLQM